MRKLLTFLIALAAIAVVSPVSAQLSGGLMFPGPGPGRGGGGVGGTSGGNGSDGIVIISCTIGSC
jgi:hypothetical protein